MKLPKFVTKPLRTFAPIQAIVIIQWSILCGVASAYQSTLDWQNVSLSPQTGILTVSFDFTPSQSEMDGFVGLSNGAAGTFNDMACSIRVFTNNRFEAYNGTGYSAVTPEITYSPGQTYDVVLSIDVVAKTYSATVDGQLLAQNFDFRQAQSSVTQLDNVVFKHQSGSFAFDALTLEQSCDPPPGDFPIYEKLASFTTMLETGEPPRNNRGHHPEELLLGPDGFFYGTTQETIFKMSPDGKLYTIVEWPLLEEQNPTLCFLGYDGNFYGFSSSGFGSIFKVSPSGNFTPLVEFTGSSANGIRPGRDPAFLVQLADGSIAGITRRGGIGTDYGTVFRLSADGEYTHLRSLTGPLGSFPGTSPVVLIDGRDGKLYGVASQGGAANAGVAFGLRLSGELEFVREFTGLSGAQSGRDPDQLLLSVSGDLYGTTASGGTGEFGTVYKMTRTGTWSLIDEIANHAPPSNSDFQLENVEGFLPLIETYSGNLYCALRLGFQGGVVFEILPQGGLQKYQVIGYGLQFQFPGKNWGTLSSFMLAADGTMWLAAHVGEDDGAGYEFGAVFAIPESSEIQLVHSFYGDSVDPVDGVSPGFLVEGSDGSIYGTTIEGGEGWGSEGGDGTVFKIDPSGEWRTIVNLGISSYPTPRHPHAAIVQGSDGFLHGTSRRGGDLDYGTVFKLSLTGELEFSKGFTGNIALYRNSTPTDGIFPTTELLEVSEGRYFGTTASAEALQYDEHFPCLFEVGENQTVNWIENLAVDYWWAGQDYWWSSKVSGGLCRGIDGQWYCTNPGTNSSSPLLEVSAAGISGVVRNADGTPAGFRSYGALASGLANGQPALYGVSPYGGSYDHGHVFRVIPGVSTTSIFSFDDSEGSRQGRTPLAGLLIGLDGKLYGTAAEGGAYGHGVFFRMAIDGSSFEVLADFSGTVGPVLGSRPVATLTQLANGDIYGTTSAGGTGNRGTVFRGKASGAIETVFDFSADPLDSQPLGRLVFCSDGNLYGTAAGDEVTGSGSVYRLVFQGAPAIYPLAGAPLSSTQYRVRAKLNAKGALSSALIRFSTSPENLDSQPPVTLADSFRGYRTLEAGATLANLSSGLTYYYRIESVNDHGTSYSPIQSFVTSGLPSATLETPSGPDVSVSSATLRATINPRNSETSVTFEYGLDGVSFPFVRVADFSPFSGNTDRVAETTVTNLMPGTLYHVRVRAQNSVGSIVDGVRSFTTLTEPEAVLGEVTALSTTRARFSGTVDAKGSPLTEVRFEWGVEGVDVDIEGDPVFPGSAIAVPPGNLSGAVLVEANSPPGSLVQGTKYHCRLRVVGLGGTDESEIGFFTLSILSGLDQLFPVPLGAPSGVLTVNLEPAGIGGGWRFQGEQRWRGGGEAATGLATGDRVVEYRPVPGYIQPPTEVVAVFSGEEPVVVPREYFLQGNAPGGTGGVQVNLEPEVVTVGGSPARWRFLGEDDSQWRSSGVTRTGLAPGSYLVESEAFAGRSTPVPASVQVSADNTALVTITYFLQPSDDGLPQQVVGFTDVSANEALPFAFVGQLRGSVGSSSGFVVKRRVVATAGHVVFDDTTLSAVTGLEWLFQRHADLNEPLPQVPRGYFIGSGYAAARAEPGVVPGEGTDRSQHYDYAALYFLNDVARGGFGGFLASEGTENEFLTGPSEKFLAGYATDIANPADRGKLHATPVAAPESEFALSQVPGLIDVEPYGTYTTTHVSGRPGSSGGPLFVKHSNGSYYPAAIYLGGSGQTVVRGIDRAVVTLFTLAETRGNGGGNSTDGGKTLTTPLAGTSSKGSLKVVLEPPTLPAPPEFANAGWRILPSTTPRVSGAERGNLSPGSYRVLISPVAGYQEPAEQTLVVTAGNLTTFTFTYQAALTPLEAWRQAHFGTTANAGDAADGEDPDHDGSTNLEEFEAGTNPRNALDVFRIQEAERTGGEFRVRFSGKAGRLYMLERRLDLGIGPWSAASPSQGPLVADGPVELTDSDPPLLRAFYRVGVSKP